MTDINALIASAIPIQPPDDWFENPRLEAPTAIKVLPNGRVYGHVASWDTDHIGLPYATKPPKSKTNYAYFKTGEIMTASGGLIPVGQLTLAGGHAGLEATAAQAARHYDDTQSAIADVTVGEDMHGIWVSGALRPDATPEKIRSLRASAPSGDWRLINGRLEMVAVCQVNVPGFPIPRALAAGGQRLALVAAGSAALVAQVAAEQELEMRLQRLEAIANEQETERLALVASAARERVQALREQSLARQAELARQRVRAPGKHRVAQSLTAAATTEARAAAITAAARKLATGDLLIESYGDVERAVEAYASLSLRERINARQSIIAAAIELSAFSALPERWHHAALTAAAVSQAKRDEAAKKGHALPDGSFPINTEADLGKAIKAFGRAGDQEAAKRHIKKRARALGKTDALPEDWKTASASDPDVHDDDNEIEDYTTVAAGNFDHLDQNFLSSKAADQPRDDNGRFVQTGAFLRWQTPGKVGYEFGQVIGRKVNPDGTMDVRLSDSNTVVKKKPNELEVIKAILPADEVDKKDDRGIPFKKKEGKKLPASPTGGPVSATPTADPLTIDVPAPSADLGNAVGPIAVGSRVRLKGGPDDLGTVSKDDDPAAIEVTADDGLVTVHEQGELEVVQAPTAPAAPSAAGPSI